MPISEQDYEARALPELRALVEALDELDLPGVECELSSDILTIELSNGDRYVVNSHRAARQIWMAADRSAWHFDWDTEHLAWIAKKTGDELWGTLGRVLSDKLGRPVALNHA
jgi:CyaY protein